MKKTINILFAFAMILSIAFIGDAISSNGSLTAKAQETTVKRKRSGGLVGTTARGTRYVAHKTKRGAIYAGKKTYQGGKYVGKKTYQGGKYVGTKTVKGTKYVGKKTVNGTKSVFSKTKKVVVGDN